MEDPYFSQILSSHVDIHGNDYGLFKFFFVSCSDTVQYQMVYSGGHGPLIILGVVPGSHIVIIEYIIEDGEIMRQVKH